MVPVKVRRPPFGTPLEERKSHEKAVPLGGGGGELRVCPPGGGGGGMVGTNSLLLLPTLYSVLSTLTSLLFTL